MTDDFKEFRNQIVRSRDKKTAKVRNSWGVYDAYKSIRKKGWYDLGRPIKEHEFYGVVRGVNSLLAAEIASGIPITFPSRMGKLELKKTLRGVSIVDNKLRINYPVNWHDTIKLWFEDEEARKNKTLLRDESREGYTIKYNKYDANYENKCFYEFAVNRFIKKALKDEIKNNKIDSLW